MTTTLVIEPGWLAELHPSGVYVLTLGAPVQIAQPAERAAEDA